MALFKFRKGGDDQTTSAPPPESVEVMRTRAKHRLIGSVVLVGVGMIGFPLLVDKQPRPVTAGEPGAIPDRHQVSPLPMPSAKLPAAVVPQPAPQTSPPPPVAVQPPKVEPAPAAVQAPSAPQATVPAKPKPKTQPKSGAKAAETRYVVQVGAFADPAKARKVHVRLEQAGLKTYVQEVNTSEGRRIRVRVGPFASHAEAEKAAAKVREMDLPVRLFEL